MRGRGRVRSVRTMATTTRDRFEEPPGYGWVVFAGTMIAIAGVLNFIYGIAAIGNSKFYDRAAEYVITNNIKTWGWFLLLVGIVQVLAAFGIWIQATWGRGVGGFSAGANIILHLIVVSGSPFLSLALVAIDVLVIYGLIAHGGRAPRPR